MVTAESGSGVTGEPPCGFTPLPPPLILPPLLPPLLLLLLLLPEPPPMTLPPLPLPRLLILLVVDDEDPLDELVKSAAAPASGINEAAPLVDVCTLPICSMLLATLV